MAASEPIPLADLTYDRLVEHVDERFEIDHESARVSLELVEVQKSGQAPTGSRQPFSALFRGPGEPILPQRIYPLEHPVLGRLDVFLVPVDQDERGVSYEMIFA